MTIEELADKIEALTARVEELEDSLAEMEGNMADVANGLIDRSVSNTYWWVEDAEDFADLDRANSYTDENILIEHTDRFRTAMLVGACKPSNGVTSHMTKMSPAFLTPDFLREKICKAVAGEYFVLKSSVFSYDDEFERVIMDAITDGKVYFAIVTNDPQTVPQQIREQLRTVR